MVVYQLELVECQRCPRARGVGEEKIHLKITRSLDTPGFQSHDRLYGAATLVGFCSLDKSQQSLEGPSSEVAEVDEGRHGRLGDVASASGRWRLGWHGPNRLLCPLNQR